MEFKQTRGSSIAISKRMDQNQIQVGDDRLNDRINRFPALRKAVHHDLGHAANDHPRGAPEKIPLFSQAYFWVLVSTLLAVPFLKVGGGLASVISPAKLQNAAASIDRIGEEAKVIPVTFVIAVAITLACAALTLFWSY